MDTNHRIVMMIGLAGLVSHASHAFKYGSDGYGGASGQAKQKQPLILMHKQALSENGAFNYAFAGDNGIKQGETINADGSRTGAYSYVDPNGETIAVKYSAGKDGFRILQGDHIPRAAVAAAASPYGAATASSAKYTPTYGRSGASEEFEDGDFPFPAASATGAAASATGAAGVVGSYSHHRSKVNPAVYRVREESSAEHFPTHFVPVAYGKPAQARSQDDSAEDDGPHSFGSGYSFEFGSGTN